MLVVCPNPTIDRQVIVPELVPGAVLRAPRNQAFPAGKSVSAARGCRANGSRPELHVLLPQEGSAWYLAALEAEGLAATTHFCPGAVRETILVYEDGGRVTVINGVGAPVAKDRWRRFVRDVCARVVPGEWVVCSGSFPPGVGADDVTDFVATVRRSGGRLAFDSGPAWLAAGMAGGPELISPNLAEAEAVLTGEAGVEPVGILPDALDRAEAAATALHARGVPLVTVTAGAAGVAWASGDGSGRLAGLEVDVVNPIGAGDAILGGVVSWLDQSRDFPQAVRWGVATACSAIAQWVPGAATAPDAARYHARLAPADGPPQETVRATAS